MAPSANPGFRRSLSWGDVPEKGRPPGHRAEGSRGHLEWRRQFPPEEAGSGDPIGGGSGGSRGLPGLRLYKLDRTTVWRLSGFRFGG